MQNNQDNIVAISTANGYAGVGIVRVSGSNLLKLAEILTNTKQIKPRYALYSDFYNSDNEIIDTGLLLFFPAPHSFTGEDVIELHAHGSPIILQMLLRQCIRLGCRIAEAGEFSRRAYLNNKLDLVQAESIIDLIYAESDVEAKGAIKSLKGSFSDHIKKINDKLVNLRVFIEASIDFPEEDIKFIDDFHVKEKLEHIRTEIIQLLKNTKQGVLLNNGANIVIVGRPNVGKSSLLNAMANEEIAIVTPVAGTTRDIIKEKIIINGIAFNITDTAGIRDTNDIVEKIGVEKALNEVKNAEICLVLIDESQKINNKDEDILSKINEQIPKLFIHNKIDLTNNHVQTKSINNDTHIYVSAKKRLGIDLIQTEILKLIGFDAANSSISFVARTRHLLAIEQAILHIENAFYNWQKLELLAEELRYAHNKLSSIIGEFSSEDLLGEIFSKFCIGK